MQEVLAWRSFKSSSAITTERSYPLSLCTLCRIKRAPLQVLQGVFHVFTTCSFKCFPSEIFQIPLSTSRELIVAHRDRRERKKKEKRKNNMLQSTLPWAGCTMTHFSRQKEEKKARENIKNRSEICLKCRNTSHGKTKAVEILTLHAVRTIISRCPRMKVTAINAPSEKSSAGNATNGVKKRETSASFF